MKRWAGDNCKSTLNIAFEQYWSVGLGATLGDRQKIKKYYSSYKDFFREKPIVSYCLMKIVGTIFEKMKVFIFFLM